MAVAFDTVYEAYGAVKKKGTLYNREYRIRAESRCVNVGRKTWEIRYYLQLKAGSTAINSIAIGQVYRPDALSPERVIGVSTIVSPARQNDSDFSDVSFDTYTGETCFLKTEVTQNDSSAIKKYRPEQSYSIGINGSNGNYSPDVRDVETPSVSYGGIDYSKPYFSSIGIAGSTSTSLTVKYSLSAPYETDVDIICNGVTIEAERGQTSITNAQHTISNLNYNQRYTISVKASCANTVQKTVEVSGNTLPNYVSSITANDVVINVGETGTISSTVLPSDATNKNVQYDSDGSGIYSLRQLNNSATVKGIKPGTGSVTVSAKDDSGVSTHAQVTVCRPAEQFRILDRYKKIYVQDTMYPNGKPFVIRYEILPNDSTDREVIFKLEGSEDQIIVGEDRVIEDGKILFDPEYPEEYRPFSVTGYLKRRNQTDLEDTFIVIPVSTYEWNTIQDPDFLTTDFCDEVFNNICVIGSWLQQRHSRTIDTSGLIQTDEGKETSITDVSVVLNQIETYIDNIYDIIKDVTEDVYLQAAKEAYGSSFSWSGTIENPRDKINRWITFLTNVYRHLNPDENIEVDSGEDGNVELVVIEDEGNNGTSYYYFRGDGEGGNE